MLENHHQLNHRGMFQHSEVELLRLSIELLPELFAVDFFCAPRVSLSNSAAASDLTAALSEISNPYNWPRKSSLKIFYSDQKTTTALLKNEQILTVISGPTGLNLRSW